MNEFFSAYPLAPLQRPLCNVRPRQFLLLAHAVFARSSLQIRGAHQLSTEKWRWPAHGAVRWPSHALCVGEIDHSTWLTAHKCKVHIPPIVFPFVGVHVAGDQPICAPNVECGANLVDPESHHIVLSTKHVVDLDPVEVAHVWRANVICIWKLVHHWSAAIAGVYFVTVADVHIKARVLVVGEGGI